MREDIYTVIAFSSEEIARVSPDGIFTLYSKGMSIHLDSKEEAKTMALALFRLIFEQP